MGDKMEANVRSAKRNTKLCGRIRRPLTPSLSPSEGERVVSQRGTG